MKAEDDATELRLKAALDAVEAREASSRETGNRLVRRLEDSKRIRDKVKAERDAGVAAARQTADATRAQLETLRREYAELQRNPFGKSRQLHRAHQRVVYANLRRCRRPPQGRGRYSARDRRS